MTFRKIMNSAQRKERERDKEEGEGGLNTQGIIKKKVFGEKNKCLRRKCWGRGGAHPLNRFRPCFSASTSSRVSVTELLRERFPRVFAFRSVGEEERYIQTDNARGFQMFSKFNSSFQP